MTIDVRNPSQNQHAVMKDFADKVEELINFVLKYEQNFNSHSSVCRLTEGMMWFHSFILNGAKLLPVQEKKEEVLDTAIAEASIN